MSEYVKPPLGPRPPRFDHDHRHRLAPHKAWCLTCGMSELEMVEMGDQRESEATS